MDGNGRWATKRLLPRIVGHRQGVQTLKVIVRACVQKEIPFLSVFAFSSENWNRPADEVSGLMDILLKAIGREVAELEREGVRLCFIGARDGLSEQIVSGLRDAEQATQHNSKLTLNVCFNYGGRWDIVNAASRVTASGRPITEATLAAELSTSSCPDPDLLIRTGGEFRLSNFLVWQMAYTELYFSPLLWPDFDVAALDTAIEEYSRRERRFGKTSEQVAQHG